jgi:hypothetical protein
MVTQLGPERLEDPAAACCRNLGQRRSAARFALETGSSRKNAWTDGPSSSGILVPASKLRRRSATAT